MFSYSKGRLESEIEHKKSLIENKIGERRTVEVKLSQLEDIKASYALSDVPTQIALDIAAAKDDIKRINKEIDSLEIQKSDLIAELERRLAEPKIPPLRPLTQVQEVRYTLIILAILFAVLLVVFVVADILLIPHLQRPATHSVVLDPSFHHLGDNDYDEAYLDSISGDKIRNLATEGLSYTTSFDMIEIRRATGVDENVPIRKAEVSLYVNHLKARRTAPAVLGLNGTLVAYLNDYVTREEHKRTPIRVLLDVPVRRGQNELVIAVGEDTEENLEGFDEYEDFEFDNLELHVEFSTARLMWWPFIGVVLAEFVVLAMVLYFLAKGSQRKA